MNVVFQSVQQPVAHPRGKCPNMQTPRSPDLTSQRHLIWKKILASEFLFGAEGGENISQLLNIKWNYLEITRPQFIEGSSKVQFGRGESGTPKVGPLSYDQIVLRTLDGLIPCCFSVLESKKSKVWL